MSPFEPIAGRARWKELYDLLIPLEVDDVLTYEVMGAAVNLDPDADRHVLQMALRRAAREYEVSHKHALDSVPNVGYRVVRTPEHLDLAKEHQKRASKSLVRGHSKVVNVDLSDVEPDVRNAFQVVAQALSMQMEMSRRLDARQSNLEKTVETVVGRQERSEAEVQELRERLARLEEQAKTEDDK